MRQISPAAGLHGLAATGIGRAPLLVLLRSAGPPLLLGILTTLLLRLIAQLPDATAGSTDSGLAGRVTWSLVVCGSLGIGTLAMHRRVSAMAAAGLVGAPLGFAIARGVRLGTVELMRLAESASGPSPILLGALKGVEYGCLGVSLAWLGRRDHPSAVQYGVVGLATGMIFGGANLVISAAAAPGPLAMPALLAWGVNELFFPIGCSLVVFVVDRGRRTATRVAG